MISVRATALGLVLATGAFASCGNSYGGADAPLADGGTEAAPGDAAGDAGATADAAPSDASAPPWI